MPETLSPPLPLPEAQLKQDVQLLSPDVQEIISRNPGWLVRNGMLLLLLIAGGLLLTTFFIRYPDVVSAKARLTSVNAPKEVLAKTEGLLERLFVKEGQQVRQHEVIGFIESRAIHEEVIGLSQLIDSMQQLTDAHLEELGNRHLPAYANLGEVQAAYQVFMQAYTTFRQYLHAGFYVQKKKMIREDIALLHRVHATLEEQRKLQQEDVRLAGQNFDASKSLSDEKVIAAMEYRNEKSKYLAKAMSVPQVKASLLNNESNRHEKEKEMIQLDNDIAQQKAIFVQALNTLKAQLDDWKNKYLLQAPVPGTVAFTDILQEKTRIRQGQAICCINPGNTSYYATVLIPQTNFGKIRTGERVLLRLPAYPSREFGALNGRLDFVAAVPTDSGFMARVSLPEGLRTDYKKQLQYREGLTAQAEVITEDLRLSDRLFHELRSLVKGGK